MGLDDAFKAFTRESKAYPTGYKVECCLGLWGVHAATRDEAVRTAKHYFVQYWFDGEYKHLTSKLPTASQSPMCDNQQS